MQERRELTETERKAIKSVMGVIEEGTVGRGPIDGPFLSFDPKNPERPYALPWDHDAVKRLFDHVESAARKQFENYDFYENQEVEQYRNRWLNAANKNSTIKDKITKLAALVETLPRSYKNVDETYEERISRITQLVHLIQTIGDEK